MQRERAHAPGSARASPPGRLPDVPHRADVVQRLIRIELAAARGAAARPAPPDRPPCAASASSCATAAARAARRDTAAAADRRRRSGCRATTPTTVRHSPCWLVALPQPRAERRSVRPEPPRHRLVDDRHQRRVGAVGRRERASFDERHAQRFEQTRRDRRSRPPTALRCPSPAGPSISRPRFGFQRLPANGSRLVAPAVDDAGQLARPRDGLRRTTARGVVGRCARAA